METRKHTSFKVRVQFVRRGPRIGDYEANEEWFWTYEVTAWAVEDSGALRLDRADGHTWFFAPGRWVSATTDPAEEIEMKEAASG